MRLMEIQRDLGLTGCEFSQRRNCPRTIHLERDKKRLGPDQVTGELSRVRRDFTRSWRATRATHIWIIKIYVKRQTQNVKLIPAWNFSENNIAPRLLRFLLERDLICVNFACCAFQQRTVISWHSQRVDKS